MNVFGNAEDCCALGSISVRQKVMKKKTLPNFEKIFLLLIKLVCFGGFFFLFCGKIRLPVETSDANLSHWNVIVQAQLIMEMILPHPYGQPNWRKSTLSFDIEYDEISQKSWKFTTSVQIMNFDWIPKCLGPSYYSLIHCRRTRR